ncbi:hypothetical protein [Ferrovibrio sp.]|uniref:DUF7946 domain-containing protein n=1 Tax=Ferrovibrio sp. TaxID=1917215 RepID=UPI0035B4F65C
MQALHFNLIYDGLTAHDHAIDMYDAAQALLGFQRSLAITTHLVLNGTVITQAPSLTGAKILSLPIEEGSWKVVAAIVGGIWAAGQAPKDTALGHLMASAYDYVVSETLGFNIDFEQTLKKQYDEFQKNKPVNSISVPRLEQSKFDAVIEKCETSMREIHRPIIWSKTAKSGKITLDTGAPQPKVMIPLNRETYNYISATDTSKKAFDFEGYVSSYSINTLKGRIYITSENRPIPFELAESARGALDVIQIVDSLRANASDRFKSKGKIRGKAYKKKSPSGRLKGLLVTEITTVLS